MKKNIHGTPSSAERTRKLCGWLLKETISIAIAAASVTIIIRKMNRERKMTSKERICTHPSVSVSKQSESVWKWLLKEVISGVAVAFAVAIATLGVQAFTQFKQEQENLSVLYLGLSRPYVESVFGPPVIEFDEPGITNGPTIRTFYKQRHSVVSCSYADGQIVAYFVIVNSDRNIYQIPFNFYIDKPTYLTDFTYADFSENVERAEIVEANVTFSHDDYAYYTETYFGASAARYNYFVIGSYKNSFDNAYIPLISNADTIEYEEDNFYKTAEYQSVRRIAKPNAFGMVDSSYLESISLVSSAYELQIYNQSIFNNW